MSRYSAIYIAPTVSEKLERNPLSQQSEERNEYVKQNYLTEQTLLETEVGKVTLKSNSHEALSNESIVKSNNDEVLNNNSS
jgi:hypothetical protein